MRKQERRTRAPFAQNLSPPECAFASQWPTPLRDFVRAEGADVVWELGMNALDYPPTWVLGFDEYKLVAAAIQAKPPF